MSNSNQPKKSHQYTDSPPSFPMSNNVKGNGISSNIMNTSSPKLSSITATGGANSGGGGGGNGNVGSSGSGYSSSSGSGNINSSSIPIISNAISSSNTIPSPFGSPPPSTSLAASGISSTSMIDHERILQCMIYDHMRRRGFLQAADFLLTEAGLPNEQQISWLAEKLMIANKSVYQATSKSGFLAYWWNTFLDLYTQRNSMNPNDLVGIRRSGSSSSISIPPPNASSLPINSPYPPPLSNSPSISSTGGAMNIGGRGNGMGSEGGSSGTLFPIPVMPQAFRLPEEIKHILFSIMKSLNIYHMTPSKMNDGEKQAFAAALSRIGLDHLIAPLYNGVISLHSIPSVPFNSSPSHSHSHPYPSPSHSHSHSQSYPYPFFPVTPSNFHSPSQSNFDNFNGGGGSGMTSGMGVPLPQKRKSDVTMEMEGNSSQIYPNPSSISPYSYSSPYSSSASSMAHFPFSSSISSSATSSSSIAPLNFPSGNDGMGMGVSMDSSIPSQSASHIRREKQIIPKPPSSNPHFPMSSIMIPTPSMTDTIGNTGNSNNSNTASNVNNGNMHISNDLGMALHMPDPTTLTLESFLPSSSSVSSISSASDNVTLNPSLATEPLLTTDQNDNLSLTSPTFSNSEMIEDPSAYFITDPPPEFEVQILIPLFAKNYTLHEGKAMTCSIVHDGSLIASAGNDHHIHIHDIESGSLILNLEEAHNGLISQIRFAPKKKMLASASFDKTIKIWDMNNTNPIMTLIGHYSSLSSIAFDPYNADKLCSCDTDGNFLVWNLQTGAISSKILVNSDPKSGISQRPIRFQPDKRSIIAIADGMDLVIYDVANSRSLLTIKTNMDKPIIAISWGLGEISHIIAISTVETISIYRLDLDSLDNLQTSGSFTSNSTSNSNSTFTSSPLLFSPLAELIGTFNFSGDKIGSILFLPPKPTLSRSASITSIMSSQSTSLTGNPSNSAIGAAGQPGGGMGMGTSTSGSGSGSGGSMVWEAILLVGTYRLITPLKIRTDSTKISRAGIILEAAHEGLVSSLALYTSDNLLMIGSTGHDGSVKTWKVVD